MRTKRDIVTPTRLSLPQKFRKVKLPLAVQHYPQVPCKPFFVSVNDETEACTIISILTQQHLWLYAQNIIPDYANAFCVVMWEEEEWVDYYNEQMEMEWSEVVSLYEKA